MSLVQNLLFSPALLTVGSLEYEELMKRLTAQWHEQAAQGRKLDEAIAKNLKNIGFS